MKAQRLSGSIRMKRISPKLQDGGSETPLLPTALTGFAPQARSAGEWVQVWGWPGNGGWGLGTWLAIQGRTDVGQAGHRDGDVGQDGHHRGSAQRHTHRLKKLCSTLSLILLVMFPTQRG